MNAGSAPRKLTLDDIADLRAYERERESFRSFVIELKRRRRVAVGPLVTFLFENRDTIRFQIQEMARVEKLATDDAVREELDIYNPMIPEPGQLCATLFVELTSDAEIKEWLPKLAGIERAVELVLPGGDAVRGTVDPQHAEGLTRPDVTAAVHYLVFDLTPDQVQDFGAGDVTLRVDLANYPEQTVLTEVTRHELMSDLVG